MPNSIPNKTQSSSVKWIVELYPFENADKPTPAGLQSKVQPNLLIGSEASKNMSTKKLATSLFGNVASEPRNELTKNINITKGLKSLTINRQKSRPDSECSIVTIGPLPKGLVIGTWAVVSSAQNEGNTGLRTIIKFIGQIEDIRPSYSAQADGTLAQQNTITLREWSTILTSKLRYDLRSVQGFLLSGGSGSTALGTIANSVSGVGQQIGQQSGDQTENLDEILADSYDPFEVVHVVLKLFGLISQHDALDRAQKASNDFYQLSLSPPKIPSAVLARLGIEVPQGDTVEIFASKGSSLALETGRQSFTQQKPAPSAYQTGFVKVVTGVRPPDVYAQGKWNGIFRSPTIEQYSQTLKDNYEQRKVRVRSASVLTGLQNQFTGWSLINEYSEAAINEVFTDMYYEYVDGSEDKIRTQPVVVVRDKPYAVREVVQSFSTPTEEYQDKIKPIIQSEWTAYDDLPRIHIKAESIVDASFSNTFLTSPNYIFVNFASNILSKIQYTQPAALSGIRLPFEMDKFGGQEYFPVVQFLGDDVNTNGDSGLQPGQSANAPGSNIFVLWFQLVAELSRVWYSYLYRMGNGSITIKDDNYPLSLGFNAQFQIGYFTLVGHIDGINSSLQVADDGTEQSTTTIQLSRVVIKPDQGFNHNLRLLPEDAWGRLFSADLFDELKDLAPPETEDPVEFFEALSQLFDNFLNLFE